METPPTLPVDLLVVGAGPIGLACALEANRAGLTARVVEKGALVNSLVGYPTQMEFFSTPELLEIGGHPLATTFYKPRREEAIDYYRGVAQREGLDVRLGERVERVDGERGAFTVVTSKGAHPARAVAVATGFFDQPNRIGVPGDDLPHVSHYYKEPYGYSGRRTVVVGAKNSAAKAALEINRHGGRRDARRPRRRDHDEREVLDPTGPAQPDQGGRHRRALRYPGGPHHARGRPPRHARRPAHASPPTSSCSSPATTRTSRFWNGSGSTFEGDERAPVVDPDTMESTRPGLYLAGTVCGGYATSRWFIENGRIHAARIAADLAGLPVPSLEAAGQP